MTAYQIVPIAEEHIPGRGGADSTQRKYIGSTIMQRPELPFDHSWDARGYDNGTARNQFFFGMDVIYKF